MTVGERIKKRRTELGLSVDQLAERLGKNRATIYRYESNDIEKFPVTAVEPLAKALYTSPAYLMGWTGNEKIDSFTNVHPVGTRSFPVLSAVACGEPILMQDEREVSVDASAEINADFILIAKGDSMTGARINDGDLVFIRSQPTVENGEIAAVAIDDEATLKRFYQYGDLVVLRAENPAYQEMQFKPEDGKNVRVLGKAVVFQSPVK